MSDNECELRWSAMIFSQHVGAMNMTRQRFGVFSLLFNSAPVSLDRLVGACLLALVLAVLTPVAAPQQTADWEGLMGYGPEPPRMAAMTRQEKNLEAALKETEKFDPDDSRIAENLDALVGVYSHQGKYAQAEPLAIRLVDVREKTLGREHPIIASLLETLGQIDHQEGRYAEAEPLFKRSLTIRETALGPDHQDLAETLNDLAQLYERESKYAEADPLYKRSLVIEEKIQGSDGPDVATILNNLANLCYSQRQYAAAEPLYKRSLAIQEKILGPENPQVATVLNNLAVFYKVQGRFAEAEPSRRAR